MTDSKATSLTIALAQINPTVGNIEGNLDQVLAVRNDAARADLIVFPETVLAGYPAEDLVLKPAFIDRIEQAVDRLCVETRDGGPALLVTCPWRHDGKLHNAVLLVDGGRICAHRYKYHLPNYGVFDEKRVFDAGPLPDPVTFRGVQLGVPICEDIWFDDVTRHLKDQSAEILLVPNSSPFEIDKENARRDLVLERVAETGLPLLYVNQVGGQDEIVFDGGSFAINPGDGLALRAPFFRDHVQLTHWTLTDSGWRCDQDKVHDTHDRLECLYEAMMLALRDYVQKNRFPGVVIGMSGGIDSALSAAVAVDALGADKVKLVMMPSDYTSSESLEDAESAAGMLGAPYDVIAIKPIVDAYDQQLSGVFDGLAKDTTEENIQARARGILLMSLSNKFGHMVVTTGNKSEMSVGYATLYGDMCGGYSVLKDMYKTDVFKVCEWRNNNKPDNALGPDGLVMPTRIITKPPSAELRPDQKDEDSLPPYDALDDILHGLVEEEESVDSIIARGHDPDVVHRIEHLLYIAEYKRRQAPPGVKLGVRNFGRDRRYPITNGFRDFKKS